MDGDERGERGVNIPAAVRFFFGAPLPLSLALELRHQFRRRTNWSRVVELTSGSLLLDPPRTHSTSPSLKDGRYLVGLGTTPSFLGTMLLALALVVVDGGFYSLA